MNLLMTVLAIVLLLALILFVLEKTRGPRL